MLGAILGDIVGSRFEHAPTKSTRFELFTGDSRFTDDTVLTVAVADWLMSGGELREYFYRYALRYPQAGYGESFMQWCLRRDGEPYHSWGNGSAMRVSPVGYVRDSLDDTLELAAESASVTHNHPEGVRGAQAVAGAIFLARRGNSKGAIRVFLEEVIGYDLSASVDALRPDYKFDVSCQGSVPESLTSFLESTDCESAIRLAISLGGDADTMACIAGSVAEPFYGAVAADQVAQAMGRLDRELGDVVQEFRRRYCRVERAG